MTSPSRHCAIVTGGGYGIGRAAALALAQQGWRILIFDRDAQRATEACLKLRDRGAEADTFVGDVTDFAAAEAAVRKAQDTLGAVTGLVNCAAFRHAGKITELSPSQWDETIKVVLYGAFNFCKAVLPGMIEAGGGAIVNVSSPDAFGRAGMSAYAAAKAGLNTLSNCLARDYLRDHVRVNVVMPGFTVTGMTEHYESERIQKASQFSVAGRAGTPEDAAALIGFLMSPAAETLTGGVYGNMPLGDY